MSSRIAVLVIALTAAHGVGAEEPAPDSRKVLEAADRILAPEIYEAETEMVAHRADGTERTYTYRVYKSGADNLLLTFDAPSTLAGHSALRRGDDLWRYIPSLKRAMRISARSDFEGGDFRNADVLRANLARDYEVVHMERTKELYALDLVARTDEAAYEKVRLWVRADNFMPVREQLYAASGKLLRSLTCQDPKDLGDGHVAPSVLIMRNEVARGRYTVLTIKSLIRKKSIPDSRFRQESMGR